MSFLSLVIQTYSPTVLVLGKFPGTDVYRDVERYDVVSDSAEPNGDLIYIYMYLIAFDSGSDVCCRVDRQRLYLVSYV